MKPADLTDEALTVAIEVARVRLASGGCLGVRTRHAAEIATLESERDLRACEALYAMPAATR